VDYEDLTEEGLFFRGKRLLDLLWRHRQLTSLNCSPPSEFTVCKDERIKPACGSSVLFAFFVFRFGSVVDNDDHISRGRKCSVTIVICSRGYRVHLNNGIGLQPIYLLLSLQPASFLILVDICSGSIEVICEPRLLEMVREFPQPIGKRCCCESTDADDVLLVLRIQWQFCVYDKYSSSPILEIKRNRKLNSLSFGNKKG